MLYSVVVNDIYINLYSVLSVDEMFCLEELIHRVTFPTYHGQSFVAVVCSGQILNQSISSVKF